MFHMNVFTVLVKIGRQVVWFALLLLLHATVPRTNLLASTRMSTRKVPVRDACCITSPHTHTFTQPLASLQRWRRSLATKKTLVLTLENFRLFVFRAPSEKHKRPLPARVRVSRGRRRGKKHGVHRHGGLKWLFTHTHTHKKKNCRASQSNLPVPCWRRCGCQLSCDPVESHRLPCLDWLPNPSHSELCYCVWCKRPPPSFMISADRWVNVPPPKQSDVVTSNLSLVWIIERWRNQWSTIRTDTNALMLKVIVIKNK